MPETVKTDETRFNVRYGELEVLLWAADLPDDELARG